MGQTNEVTVQLVGTVESPDFQQRIALPRQITVEAFLEKCREAFDLRTKFDVQCQTQFLLRTWDGRRDTEPQSRPLPLMQRAGFYLVEAFAVVPVRLAG